MPAMRAQGSSVYIAVITISASSGPILVRIVYLVYRIGFAKIFTSLLKSLITKVLYSQIEHIFTSRLTIVSHK